MNPSNQDSKLREEIIEIIRPLVEHTLPDQTFVFESQVEEADELVRLFHDYCADRELKAKLEGRAKVYKVLLKRRETGRAVDKAYIKGQLTHLNNRLEASKEDKK